MGALDGSLRRLGTDYVDIYFNHAVNDTGKLDNPEWFEFVERAKQQGKIRFTGMSGHAGRLIECLDHAFDMDMVDVVLIAHNFGQDPAFYDQFTRGFDLVVRQPGLPRVLARAKSLGVRRGGHEDAHGRQAQRHAALRARRRILRPGGVPAGRSPIPMWMR